MNKLNNKKVTQEQTYHLQTDKQAQIEAVISSGKTRSIVDEIKHGVKMWQVENFLEGIVRTSRKDQTIKLPDNFDQMSYSSYISKIVLARYFKIDNWEWIKTLWADQNLRIFMGGAQYKGPFPIKDDKLPDLQVLLNLKTVNYDQTLWGFIDQELADARIGIQAGTPRIPAEIATTARFHGMIDRLETGMTDEEIAEAISLL